jgi:hypothetical protein
LKIPSLFSLFEKGKGAAGGRGYPHSFALPGIERKLFRTSEYCRGLAQGKTIGLIAQDSTPKLNLHG